MTTRPQEAQEREPKGLILVAHEVLGVVPQEDMLSALPAEYLSLPREIVHLQSVSAKLDGLSTLDWGAARRNQDDEVRKKLKPLIVERSNWRLQYFGAAPIPLAVALGYSIGGWIPVDIFQRHHGSGSWRWPSKTRSSKAQFKDLLLPEERLTLEGDIVVRVAISHHIDTADTTALLPQNIGEIDLELISPNEDALESPQDLEALREHFDKIIDWAHAYRPNARLHVFAAVGVGVAFRIGLCVNPTIHSPIYTYQFSKLSSPRYIRALVLQSDTEEVRPLTSEQVAAAAKYRQQCEEELRKIISSASALCNRSHWRDAASWLANLLPDLDTGMFHGPIVALKTISETPLHKSSIAQTITTVQDGFRFDQPSRTWQLDDRLLLAISARLRDSHDHLQAVRLLLLHEGIHLASHGLTDATAQKIRRFPKIVEEVDYQADVWAFIHDYVLRCLDSGTSDEDARTFFHNVLRVALETFWAFDAGGERRRIEIRRLNRYLIWYWQQLRIAKCTDLRSILMVLAEHPLIEIAGSRAFTSEGRIFYSLDPLEFFEPELCVLINNRLKRYGQSPGSRVRDVLLGFRDRNSEQIRFGLQSMFDQHE